MLVMRWNESPRLSLHTFTPMENRSPSAKQNEGDLETEKSFLFFPCLVSPHPPFDVFLPLVSLFVIGPFSFFSNTLLFHFTCHLNVISFCSGLCSSAPQFLILSLQFH